MNEKQFDFKDIIQFASLHCKLVHIGIADIYLFDLSLAIEKTPCT